jgi:hypothetical protein
MYYITQDEKCLITGRYTLHIHRDAIPADAVEVSEEIFNASIQMQRPALVNSKLVELPAEQPTQEQLTQTRINELKSLLAGTDFKVLPDYQSRSGKTDAEISQVVANRKAWYDELKGLIK